MIEPDFPWLSADVVGLCRSMRETQDYSALPMLHDALMEAGFHEERCLLQMRSAEGINACRLVALIFSKDTADAVLWIEAFASQLDLSYRELMEHVRNYIETGDVFTEYGSSNMSDIFWGSSEDFWRNYELVIGSEVKEKDASIFSCSC